MVKIKDLDFNKLAEDAKIEYLSTFSKCVRCGDNNKQAHASSIAILKKHALLPNNICSFPSLDIEDARRLVKDMVGPWALWDLFNKKDVKSQIALSKAYYTFLEINEKTYPEESLTHIKILSREDAIRYFLEKRDTTFCSKVAFDKTLVEDGLLFSRYRQFPSVRTLDRWVKKYRSEIKDVRGSLFGDNVATSTDAVNTIAEDSGSADNNKVSIKTKNGVRVVEVAVPISGSVVISIPVSDVLKLCLDDVLAMLGNSDDG